MSRGGVWVIDADHTPREVEWAEYTDWLAKGFEETKRVARTEVGVAAVSTVFLALDHSHGDGPPLLFETMVFGGEHSGACFRYATWDEAVAGHARVVAALTEGREP